MEQDGIGAAVTAIDVFVQAEGRAGIAILKVVPRSAARDVIAEAVRYGLTPVGVSEILTSLEGSDEPLLADQTLEGAGAGHRSRLHIHRCRRVDVTVHFNARTIAHQFSPAATMAKVTEWAAGKNAFNLAPVDAVEHLLQVSGTTERPDEDAHLGTLVHAPTCAVSFDLVPKVRVEG